MVMKLDLPLKEEHRLKIFCNSVMRRLFGTKRVEATGGWRKFHNAEFHNFRDFTANIRIIKSRKLRPIRHLARMRQKRNSYKVFAEKPESKRPPGTHNHR
jgi:hypothetical protein